MVIPGELKVLGHYYEVLRSDDLELRRGVLGSCCANVLRIELASGVPESEQAETFLHEILEAIRYHLGMGEEFRHETLVRVSEVLFQVMRDNGLNFSDRGD